MFRTVCRCLSSTLERGGGVPEPSSMIATAAPPPSAMRSMATTPRTAYSGNLTTTRRHAANAHKELRARASASMHEVRMLNMGHSELTLRLKLLYHKLHTASVLSQRIEHTMNKRVYQKDRAIASLMRQLKRVSAEKADTKKLFERANAMAKK